MPGEERNIYVPGMGLAAFMPLEWFFAFFNLIEQPRMINAHVLV